MYNQILHDTIEIEQNPDNIVKQVPAVQVWKENFPENPGPY